MPRPPILLDARQDAERENRRCETAAFQHRRRPVRYPADFVGFQRIQHLARIEPASDTRHDDPDLARVAFRGHS